MPTLLHQVFETLWFFLPAMMANMAPIAAQDINLWPALNRPLDGGKSWRGERLLGSHKTIRGVVIGVAVATLVGYVQYLLSSLPALSALSLAEHSSLRNALLIGFLSGFGALAGDALKSFFKRRLHITAGKSWALFDQIDFIIGATIAAGWLAHLTATHILIALVIIGLGSYITSIVGVHLHIKQSL